MFIINAQESENKMKNRESQGVPLSKICGTKLQKSWLFFWEKWVTWSSGY
jgi:hypothetical protein